MAGLLSSDEARDAITVPREVVDLELDDRLTLANDATGLWLNDITDSILVGEDGEFPTESEVPADLKTVAKHHLAWSWALLEGAPGDGTDFGAPAPFDVPRRIFNLLPGRYAPGVA